MPLPRYKVRCHSISYKTMEDIVVKMVNNLQSGKIKAAQFREVLNALWEAIVLDTTPRSKFQNMASEKIEYLSTLEDFQNADAIAAEANLLVRALNNSISNLRSGWSDWNSSVQDYFDPVSWAYIVAPLSASGGGGKDAKILATNEDPCMVENIPDSNYMGAPICSTGFYLTDPTDAARMKALRVYKQYWPHSLIFNPVAAPLKVNAPAMEQGMSDPRHYILFSSSNAWELQSIPYVRNERYPTIFVYYLDDEGSAPHWQRV